MSLKKLEVFGTTSIVPVISVNMLFTDITRLNMFLKPRLKEFGKVKAPLEVLIAINSDASRSAVEATLNGVGFAFDVKAIWTGQNNIPFARNLLAKQSRGEFLLISDDDCELSKGSIDFMLEQIRQFPIGVVGLRSVNEAGETFKPRPWEPTCHHDAFNGLHLVAGVHGMSFMTYRQLMTDFPLSEVRTLRGEWVDWFTRLWRAGVPSAYAIRDEFFITDHAVPGGSATRYHDRMQYVLQSLLCLAYEYDLQPENLGWQMLLEKYLLPNLRDEDKEFAEELWQSVLKSASSRFRVPETLPPISVFTRHMLLMACAHCRSNLGRIRRFKRRQVDAPGIYRFAPFEAFDPKNSNLLDQILDAAAMHLPQYIH